MIGIVIVGYNSWQHLEPCLQSIERHAPGVPTVLVDNASRDGTVAAVSERFPWVRIIANADNRGYAAACNQGIGALGPQDVLILNPDIEVTPGAIAAMEEIMAVNPTLGMLSARLCFPDGEPQASARTIPTPWIVALRRTPLGRIRRARASLERHLNAGKPSGPLTLVDWMLGACMWVRRSAIDRVGPMDEGFFLYFEDVDWCYRMWRAGYRVARLDTVTMIHHHDRASARGLNRALHLHLASAARFFAKYPHLAVGLIPSFLPSSARPS